MKLFVGNLPSARRKKTLKRSLANQEQSRQSTLLLIGFPANLADLALSKWTTKRKRKPL